MTKSGAPSPENPWASVGVITALLAGVLLISAFFQYADVSLLCRPSPAATSSPQYRVQLEAIVHYATSTVVPQQNHEEISISFGVLMSRAPCNFLVFGLGHDSMMWAALNPGGLTLFLEEDPEWVQAMSKQAPNVNAHVVQYRTQLKDSDLLLKTYRNVPDCAPSTTFLRGNSRCRLALDNLPNQVYEKEWDLIMIDAPKGYFDAAPGRMAAIYSAAVMARSRKGSGYTDVFLHDVDRKVEREYAEEFLCKKYLVGSAGRLWHFQIPPALNATLSHKFC
ncbi:hypothetical protein V2J09_021320 [Rumex salicifolius]